MESKTAAVSEVVPGTVAGAVNPEAIPATLLHPAALRFWLAVGLTGIGTGLGAAALTRLLQVVQAATWGGNGTDILDTAQHVSALRHVEILLLAAVVTCVGQLILKQLPAANGIDTTAAIWFRAGRLPALRTLGSATLSVIIVGLGVSLGREGAPKQAGAVFANLFSDRGRLSDEQRRLLVACGAGAGMAAAYGVPVGGAIFAVEVMRGKLALRYVLPALFTAWIATGVAWIFLPNRPTYEIPAFVNSASLMVWALVAAPIAGVASVWYVRAVTWADRHRPTGWQRLALPVAVMGALGVASIWFPQILGNGRDVSQLAFNGQVAPVLVLILLLLKPMATIFCMRSGAPGGMFTPSLTFGALLGGAMGLAWGYVWPGVPGGLFALLGAGAVLGATTQGPVSSVILLMELTGRDRSFILPLLIMVCLATLVSRSIEPRAIYDARLSEEEIAERARLREMAA
jgi:chloride channel protein, CIC family